MLDNSGKKVGEVTSGCPSPSLSINIAMAYVPLSLSKAGTKVDVEIRKKLNKATVTKMPFVPANYYTSKS